MIQRILLLIPIVLLSVTMFSQEIENEHYYNAIRKYSELSDNAGALEDLDLAAKLTPNHPLVYNLRAKVKFALKDLDGALDDFEKSVEIDEENVKLKLDMAAFMFQTEEYRGAVSTYTEILKTHKDIAEVHYDRGMAFSFLNSQVSAVNDVMNAIKLDPRNDHYYSTLALVRTRGINLHNSIGEEKYKMAIKDMDKAIGIAPKNAKYYSERGYFKYRLHQNLGAIADFSKAIELDTENPDTYNRRGLVKMQMEDNRGATNDFTQAIARDNKEKYYMNRGLAKFNGGQYRSAVFDYQKAIDKIEAMKAHAHGDKITLSEAYIMQGLGFVYMNNSYQGCRSFLKARDLGNKRAEDYVRRYCR